MFFAFILYHLIFLKWFFHLFDVFTATTATSWSASLQVKKKRPSDDYFKVNCFFFNYYYYHCCCQFCASHLQHFVFISSQWLIEPRDRKIKKKRLEEGRKRRKKKKKKESCLVGSHDWNLCTKPERLFGSVHLFVTVRRGAKNTKKKTRKKKTQKKKLMGFPFLNYYNRNHKHTNNRTDNCNNINYYDDN